MGFLPAFVGMAAFLGQSREDIIGSLIPELGEAAGRHVTHLLDGSRQERARALGDVLTSVAHDLERSALTWD